MEILDKRGMETLEETQPITMVDVSSKIPEAPNYSKINLRMAGTRVLIQMFPPKEKIGSIYVKEYDISMHKGRIVQIGDECKTFLRRGDIVIAVAGFELPNVDASDGNKYTMLPEDSIICIDTDFHNPDRPEEFYKRD